MEKFIRGIIEREGRDFVEVKYWMQYLFPNEDFMECDEGYYFEIPIDINLFTNGWGFCRYLNENFSAAMELDFCLSLIMEGFNFLETYIHFRADRDDVDQWRILQDEILDTVQKWLKWDKLHKEYHK